MMTLRPALLISGGQTGADRGALRAGLACGIPTGGWAPKNYMTEYGSAPWLRTRYGLMEHPDPGYLPRTRANVHMASATILFGEVRSPGSYRTVEFCDDAQKPYLINPISPELLDAWTLGLVQQHGWGTFSVNIAGNRESVNPGLEAYVYRFLIDAWAPEADRPRLHNSAPWPKHLPRLEQRIDA